MASLQPELDKTWTRHRWGLQMHTVLDKRWTGPLGCEWVAPQDPPRPYQDFWPASFLTRDEARSAARILANGAAQHSERWAFRAIKLHIQITVI